MIYFILYFAYALTQGAWATREVLRDEKYITERDTIVLLVVVFTVIAPIITALIALDAMRSVIVFLVTGEK
jgi:hypothetical protein